VAEISAWMDWCHAAYSIKDAEAWVATRDDAWSAATEYSFAIEDPSGRFLGGCGLNRIDAVNQTANIGYWVRTSAAGRGVATEAVGQLVCFALGEPTFHRLEILAAVGNRASQRVAEKLGAAREGVLRERLRVRGERQDAVLFSILSTDLGVRSRRQQPATGSAQTSP